MVTTLKLVRNRFYPTHTIGQLYVNDNFFCFTLEDVVRERSGEPVERWKIDGETAIPYGIYKVVFEWSNKFGPDTLTLKNVPGFKYIRMHSGNTPADTEGCIIVGYKLTDKGMIVPGSTKPALRDLKVACQDLITIEITQSPYPYWIGETITRKNASKEL